MGTDQQNPEPAAASPSARCAVTGQEFPPDELIVLFNHEVSQEGKEILLDRVRSGALLPGESVSPPALTRLFCYFGDGLLFGVAVAGAVSVMAITGHARFFRAIGRHVFLPRFSTLLWLFIVAVQVLFVAYFAVFHHLWGQTPGKKAGAVVVTTVEGRKLGAARSWLRALALLGPAFLIDGALLTGSRPIIGAAYLLAMAYFLTDIFVGLVDRQARRTLHDRIAGTRVMEQDNWV